MAQTQSNTNRQDQIQTVHVALRKTLVQKIKATAMLNRRSLNAQVAMLVEQAFAKENPNG
jgi:hypothetical protein